MQIPLSIITHPEVWPLVGEDNTDRFSYKLPDKRSHIHLVGYVNNILIGSASIIPRINKDRYCHFQVLPEYRGKYAIIFARKCLKWVWDNVDVDILYFEIPDKFPNTQAFSKLCGAIEEAKIKKIDKKNKNNYSYSTKLSLKRPVK